MSPEENFENLNAGDHHYKAYVGPPLKYDLVGAMQFNLLTAFGLRDNHKLLDIGCGSLRAGKLLIPYLRKGNYFGIEPNKWLIDDGIKHEIGQSLVDIKTPQFSYSENFELGAFHEKFDYLVAQSIFSHASSAQITTCLREAKEVLLPEGLFLATFILGKENYSGTDWVYPGCVNYTHDYILKMVRDQKLDAIKTNWLHPNGQTWYVIFQPENKINAQKIADSIFEINKVTFSWNKFLKEQKLLDNKIGKKILRKLNVK